MRIWGKQYLTHITCQSSHILYAFCHILLIIVRLFTSSFTSFVSSLIYTILICLIFLYFSYNFCIPPHILYMILHSLWTLLYIFLIIFYYLIVWHILCIALKFFILFLMYILHISLFSHIYNKNWWPMSLIQVIKWFKSEWNLKIKK